MVIVTFSNVNTLLSEFDVCLSSCAMILSLQNLMLCLLTHPFCVYSGRVWECCRAAHAFRGSYSLPGERQVGSRLWTVAECEQGSCS